MPTPHPLRRNDKTTDRLPDCPGESWQHCSGAGLKLATTLGWRLWRDISIARERGWRSRASVSGGKWLRIVANE